MKHTFNLILEVEVERAEGVNCSRADVEDEIRSIVDCAGEIDGVGTGEWLEVENPMGTDVSSYEVTDYALHLQDD